MRKIYVNPDELIEVRIVDEGIEKNAKEWDYQLNPNSFLVSFGHNLVKVDIGTAVLRNGICLVAIDEKKQ